MSVEVSILLDTRRIKQKGVYPLKLRVYYAAKTQLYPFVYDLTQEDFKKLGAKRVSDSLLEVRDNLNGEVKSAQNAADAISPFSFQRFYQEFIYGNPLFREKKAKIKALAKKDTEEAYPEKWVKMFPILKEDHPGPDYISKIYFLIIKSLLKENRIGNASNYQSSYSSFKSFRGNVRFNEITKHYLKEYDSWMVNTLGNSKTTVGIYARALRAVVNEAIELKLMKKDDYPFGRRKYLIPTGRNIKKALSKQVISKLYYSETEKVKQEKARDFWFLGYYCVGINVKDIIELKYKNIKGEFLCYHRGKVINTVSGKEPTEISVYMNEEVITIINKWGNKDRNPENYIFPILNPGMTAIEAFEAKRNFVRWINKNMAKICDKEGIIEKVKTMEYRHSSSTMMKNAGVPGQHIKDLMGHSSLRTTENYFGSFEDLQKKEYAKTLDGFKNANTNEQEAK